MAIKTDIHVPLRMNPTDFDDLLTFILVLLAGDGAAVAQKVDRVIYSSDDPWYDPLHLQSA